MARSPASLSPKTLPMAPGALPLLGHALRIYRRPTEFLESLRGMGDIVALRLGPLPVYAVTTPDLVHQMLVTQARFFDKGYMVDKIHGIVCSGGDFHTRQRRLLQPSFHHKRLDCYAETMRARTQARICVWQADQRLDLTREMHELSLDIAANTLFSTDLASNVVAEIQHCLPIVLAGAATRTLSPFSFLEKLPTPGNRRFRDADRRLRAVIDSVIQARRADGADRGDLLSMVLAARDADTGEQMTDQQVQDELVTLLVAGAETTADTLCFLFHEFCRHPEVEQRLADELRQVLDGRPSGYDDVAALGYLHHVISEILRLRNPIWLLMRRSTAEIELGGTRFPPGTEFLFSIPRLHADPSVFPQPDRFDPDRWHATPANSIPKGGYLPFGAGKRQCIGNDFAWIEMAVIVATILTQWRLEPVPGHDIHPVYDAVARLNQLPVICRLRLPLTRSDSDQ